MDYNYEKMIVEMLLRVKSKGSGITTVALFSALISLYLAKYRHMSANNREGGYI